MKQAKEKVYKTGDGKELVGEGDERAAFLYAIAGAVVEDSEADQFSNFYDFFGHVESGPAPAHHQRTKHK